MMLYTNTTGMPAAIAPFARAHRGGFTAALATGSFCAAPLTAG